MRLPESPTHMYASMRGEVACNTLLVGQNEAITRAVQALQSICPPPIIVWNCGGSPVAVPPPQSVRTLILHDVGVLSLEEQQALSDWLEGECGHVHVIATNSVPLYPMIQLGAFSDTLYYRLNVIYTEVSAVPVEIKPAA